MAWRKKNFAVIRAAQDIPNILEPPLDYPKILFTPMPLEVSSRYKEMLRMKQEVREWSRSSCYFQVSELPKKDIERYSDKYIQKDRQVFVPNYSLLPDELKQKKHNRHKHIHKKPKLITEDLDTIISKHLETEEDAAKKDVAGEEAGETKKKNEEEEEDIEEDEEDEDGPLEEDADYLDNYFDNGENEGYESAASNDEPVF